MSMKELNIEARRRYPIGTEFKCVHGFGIGKVINHDHNGSRTAVWMNWDKAGACGSVYHDDVWAEVISYPKGHIPENINKSYILI